MGDTPRDLADQAAEAIRSLNHLTRGEPGDNALEYPADVYSVVANLKIMTERLPQLFGQLTEWLWAEQAAGRVAHDQGKDAGLTVAGVDHHLTEARVAAGALYDALNGAHNELAGLKAAS
jgi:hypothetical protein